MMTPRKPQQASKPSSLSQQQADFTAEGAPPPVQVAVASAVIPTKKAGALPPPPKARKGPPSTKGRWQR